MKQYETPLAKIVFVESEDVLTGSPEAVGWGAGWGSNGNGWGSTWGGGF